MMTDTIADMLTRIRNAQLAKKRILEVPFSSLKFSVAEVLSRENYVGKIEKVEARPVSKLKIELNYSNNRPAIQSIRRESKPGHRMYRKAGELPDVLNGYGIAVVSTSRGIMTSKEAKKLGVGGEVICTVF